jgi:hypothetical protein
MGGTRGLLDDLVLVGIVDQKQKSTRSKKRKRKRAHRFL